MDPQPVAFPTLETQRLLLRQLALEDASDYFEFASDPEVNRFLPRPPHSTVEDSKERIEYALKPETIAVHKQWGIILKENGKLIGVCGLFVESEKDGRAGIGYAMNRAYWNRGYATEAARAVIAYGFRDLGFNRIEAMCLVENDGSARVMERAGMQYEGILRQYMLAKEEYRDVKVYSVLRSEWDNNWTPVE